jgi:hypothetical protein
MDSVKISDSEIQITKTPVVAPVTEKYERGFIERQKKEIQKQKDADNALRDAELAECDAILAEMDKKGVLSKQSITIEEVIP